MMPLRRRLANEKADTPDLKNIVRSVRSVRIVRIQTTACIARIDHPKRQMQVRSAVYALSGARQVEGGSVAAGR